MPLLRYQSPDDPAFVVFDQSRFRVEHGTFFLRTGSVRARIGEALDEQAGWNLRAMKLVEENRRLRACAEWLDSLPPDEATVVVPELVHEPAIDRVADRLIGDGDFEVAECPACAARYAPGELMVEPWSFEEEGTTVLGRRTICSQGHTIHALRDAVEVQGIELEGD